MKIRKTLGSMAGIVVSASMIAVAALYAGSTMPVEIMMEAPYEHEESIALFTHQKHVVDYQIGCGQCHHDDKGQPLVDLKEGDEVQSCFACHSKPGEIKGKDAKGLSKSEKLAYHANAVHDNCIGCHREYNREKKTKAAPTLCTDCHPRKKK